MVDSIRRCKQRIKVFLLYHGFDETKSIKNWSSNYEEQIAALPLETEGRLTIESHLHEPTFIENELRSVIDQLEQMNKHPRHQKVIKSLTSFPDVGKIVATTFDRSSLDVSGEGFLRP